MTERTSYIMQIELYDKVELIKINDLKQVTNPVMFAKGAIPSYDGLLSTEIFGSSLEDRKKTFAYIDLNDWFLNPIIYKMLNRMNNKFIKIIGGQTYYSIVNGDLVEDPDGGTGLSFLYDNWEKINFKKTDVLMRNERIDVLNHYDKNTLFNHHWIVIPAFYRDVNLTSLNKGKISHHEINDKYSRLIRLSNILTGSHYGLGMDRTKLDIQKTLVEIYDIFKARIEKKDGLIRKSLLGKSIDYGSRLVISAPTFNASRPADLRVDFTHCGLPLAQCCSLFTPFIVSWVHRFFTREFITSGNKYMVKDKDGNIRSIELDDPESYFSSDYIEKHINTFINSRTSRFDPIELPTKDKSKKYYFTFAGRIYDKNKPESESPINRYATWTDILYQAAYETLEKNGDKHVYITRYPLSDYFGIYPNKIRVLSTVKTIPMYINNTVYEHYPYVDLSIPPQRVPIYFSDTLSISNVFLKGLGGDYDGDQVTVKGVFTQEANEEANELINSKSNILNMYGENMRDTTNEGILTLYMMTKFQT